MKNTYIMRDSRDSNLFKIGTSKNVSKREKTLSYEIPSIQTVISIAFDIEKELHVFFAEKRIRGEWFDLNNNDLIIIESLMRMNYENAKQFLKSEKKCPYTYIKDRRKFFNISSIEKECKIKRTSLLNAINRNQKTFKQSNLLMPFLNKNFPFWVKR